MVYLILGEGFEEVEAIAPADMIRRAEVEIKTVGLAGKRVTGGHGIAVEADITIDEVDPGDMEMIVLPGGNAGVSSIKACEKAIELVKYAYNNGKAVAAICAAPSILAELGYLNGRRAVCHPTVEEAVSGAGAILQRDMWVVHDHGIVTGRAAGASVEFGLKLVSLLKGWAASETIRKAICYERNTRPLT